MVLVLSAFSPETAEGFLLLSRPNTLSPDVLCVDPPRKGLSPEVVAAAASMAPQRIVYVSCDPATLARDVKRFAQAGYAAVRAAAVDMFPGTANVETVARLERCV